MQRVGAFLGGIRLLALAAMPVSWLLMRVDAFLRARSA